MTFPVPEVVAKVTPPLNPPRRSFSEVERPTGSEIHTLTAMKPRQIAKPRPSSDLGLQAESLLRVGVEISAVVHLEAHDW